MTTFEHDCPVWSVMSEGCSSGGKSVPSERMARHVELEPGAAQSRSLSTDRPRMRSAALLQPTNRECLSWMTIPSVMESMTER